MTSANGRLRVMAAASLPSASTQAASSLMPASVNTVASGTPVHSLVLMSPCVSWTVSPVGPFHSFPELPEHSMNSVRVTEGNRARSFIENVSGRSTRPWIRSRWRSESMAGTPLWWRSKCSAEGVMMPCKNWCGVREWVAVVRRWAVSPRARDP